MIKLRRLRVTVALLAVAGLLACDSGPTSLDEGLTPQEAHGNGHGGNGGTNQPPTVSAGQDQTVASGSWVDLQGTADDPDGRIASSEWTQTSGISVNLMHPNKLQTGFTAPTTTAEEKLVFLLTVWDNDGASASDEVTFTVEPSGQPVNQPPTVSAGADQSVDPGATVTLSGQASDPDGQVASVSWSQTAGTSASLQNADQLQATFTAPTTTGQTLTFVLTAVDDQGASASDEVQVTVGSSSSNQPPVVSAGDDQTVTEGDRVTIKGEVSDPDGYIDSKSWSQTSGPHVSYKTTGQNRLSFTAPQVTGSEVLVFTLTAVDNEGASASDDVAITVVGAPEPNAPPTVSAGDDQTVPLGAFVSLSGTASDSDGQVVSVTWAQLSGTPVSLQGANQLQASFSAPGVNDIVIFTLTAVDDDGASSSSFVRISVGSEMVQAGFRYSTYGPDYDPGPQYWANTGLDIASRFPGSRPQAIWIVGEALLDNGGTLLSFPGSSSDPYISFSSSDNNEAALDLFDQIGLDVWLQVEPGDASVPELIDLILNRYGHHPSVMGVGVDVEWYRFKSYPTGKSVSNADASSWLAAARAHRSSYRLFLKHWLASKMPSTVRDGITFIDDSQGFSGLNQMVDSFQAWGTAFSSASVGFQYGYPSDSTWWSGYSDPMKTIGDAILAAVPNAKGVFWVDFTILDVFPP